MAISENSAKIFEYLKGYVGQKVLTVDSIAKETGLSQKSVNGTLLALSRHNIFTREPGISEEDGTAIKYIVPTEEINNYDPYAPTASDTKKNSGSNYSDTSIAILKLLKTKVDTNENFTAADIAQALSLPLASVNGSLTGFQKKGLVERLEPKGVMINNQAKNVRYIKVLPAIKEVEV